MSKPFIYSFFLEVQHLLNTPKLIKAQGIPFGKKEGKVIAMLACSDLRFVPVCPQPPEGNYEK